MCNCLFVQAFSIVFSEMINVFYEQDPSKLRSGVLFWMGMFFVIAGGAAIFGFAQPYFFIKAGERLTTRLRDLAFRGMLRQDMSFFDNTVRLVLPLFHWSR